MSHDHNGSPDKPIGSAASGRIDELPVRDEVCGMRFPAGQAAATTEFQGKTYWFCSQRCRERFLEHPAWYVPVAP